VLPSRVPLLISLARTHHHHHRHHATGQLGGPSSPADSSDNGDDTLGRALRKAVEAGDPDLVYLALFAAYRSRTLPEFWRAGGPSCHRQKPVC